MNYYYTQCCFSTPSPSQRLSYGPKPSLCFSNKMFDLTAKLSHFSKTSTGFYSNAHWRCSNVEEPGWSTNRFDDSHWPYATAVLGFGYYNNDEFINEYPTDSRFIWTDSNSDTSVFCRGRMCYGNLHRY